MEKYWEWLCSIPGIDTGKIEFLIQCFHDPESIWMATEQEWEYLKEKGFHWGPRVMRFQKTWSPDRVCDRHYQMGISFVSRENGRYPLRLQTIPNAPYGLFYKGNLPSEEKMTVAIIGARMCSRQGKELAEQLAAVTVRNGGQVVSGAAYGIDGAAQAAALEKENGSYAVLGCGVDIAYPSVNRRVFEQLASRGGILSEYPPGTEPQKRFFPLRNRIISGLADVVVVVEAKLKSGSLITVDYAAEQSRRVMAAPGRPGDDLSEGCNELIAQGAEVLTSVENFRRTLFGEQNQEKSKVQNYFPLAPSEELVYSSVGLLSKNIWELQEMTSLSFGELSKNLISLEDKGLILECENNRYRRK